MSDRREEVLRFAAAGGGERSDLPKVAMRAEVLPPTQDEAALTRATFNVSTRHIAWTRLGMISLAQGDTAEAGERFEQALLYNADDPLLWWEAAAAARVAGRSGDEEPAELLNAHYLSPLEPALRAEAFLSQPVEPGKEPNPLVAPLDEAPESYIEVAAMLVEHGLLSDATRWIDEALRHADLAMLRILLAYCYLSGSRMAAEAASEIQKAEALGLPTPLPWRRVEIDALRAVGSRFPEAVGIRKWLELAERLATRTPRDT
jgi:tetratricopeptide (TPR) repeat protein